MQPKFIREQHRILTTEGTLDFVTDDVPYSSWTVNMMLQPALGFAPVHPAPHYICGDIGYGVSYFERLWRDQGREIRYHRFHKSK
jgi:tRNA G46 methylase TrmB